MKYVILDTANLTQAMVDACQQTSLASVRKSLDESKCILKYSGSQPAELSGETEYTHSQILDEVVKVEWQIVGD